MSILCCQKAFKIIQNLQHIFWTWVWSPPPFEQCSQKLRIWCRGAPLREALQNPSNGFHPWGWGVVLNLKQFDPEEEQNIPSVDRGMQLCSFTQSKQTHFSVHRLPINTTWHVTSCQIWERCLSDKYFTFTFRIFLVSCLDLQQVRKWRGVHAKIEL